MSRVMNACDEHVAAPADWKTICISVYVADLRRLERLVARLHGTRPKVNRSSVIRLALERLEAELDAGGVVKTGAWP